ARPIAAVAANAGLTRVGEVVGTPEYMSPEQATGDNVDGRSDLYSLGLTAYFALTARGAITGESVSKVLMRQITEVLPPMQLARPDLPASLGAAIDRCLMKDPAARFDRAESLVEALDAAQLAAPEIPVAIRLFAQEAGTLSLIVTAGAVVLLIMLQSPAMRGSANLDAMLPLLLLIGVLVTRVLQTLGEARRLALSGYSAADVHRGLRAVMAERQGRRDELRHDAATRRARRRTVVIALAELAAAVLMMYAGLAFRVQIGPRQYQTSMPGIVLAFSGMALIGVSMVLLLRGPFRTPIGERLFRLVWLGPIGRGFVRFAGRRVARSSSATVTTAPGAWTPSAPAVSAVKGGVSNDVPVDLGAARVAGLETRVAELERWRKELAAGRRS
ncbi:MAG TPA: hypothetical protein VII52_07265, partial [Gemmatimonadaceae bacterium]